MSNGVKFIRVRGRIVPIRDAEKRYDPKLLKQAGAKNSISKKDAVNTLRSHSKEDAKLAKSGVKVANIFGSAALVGAAVGIYGSGKAKAIGKTTALVGIAGAMINRSFASGRYMSSQNSEKYARNIEKGKAIGKKDGIGGAVERTHQLAKRLKAGIRKNKTGV